MYDRYENAYYAAEFASFLEKELIGENCVIYGPASVNKIDHHRLLFIDNVWCKDFDFDKISGFSDILIVTDKDYTDTVKECSFIVTPNPRVDFIRLLNKFFVKVIPANIHLSSVIEPGAQIGKNVTVGAHSYIGPNVVVGDSTIIQHNVVIDGMVTIGKNCVVKSNATIGSEGFSFIFDENEYLQHFPQIGEIIIGDDVWIGANTTIERAALDDTTIEDGVKVDDLVQIGHNSHIGKSSQITAGVVVCGRAVIGARSWVAPNACVNNGVKVGEDALIGMGAVVLTDVPSGTVVAGVPAKPIKKKF